MLKAQVDSILAQRGVEVRLVRREDTFGEGACANFAALLAESTADYAAFADQDDVWKEDKLARSMAKMHELESCWGRETPLCVFTDSTIVDAGLEEIAPSHLAYAGLDPMRLSPRQLVQQNVASGNTMLFNAALRKVAQPIPAQAVMHDHWLMLAAALYGHIAFLDEATLLYRQHGNNVLGAGRPRLTVRQIRERIHRNMEQAACFPEFACLKDYGRRSSLMRRWLIVRHGFWKNGLLRNLGALLLA